MKRIMINHSEQPQQTIQNGPVVISLSGYSPVKTPSAATIVFDGVISQRILDISSEKQISTVVGTRKGNITKMPAGITIWTKEDLY